MQKNLYSKSRNILTTIIFILAVALVFLLNTSLKFSASGHGTQTEITSSVLSYVNKYYIDKSKIDPVKMLEQSLAELEQIIDEVLIDFNNDSKKFIVQVNDNKKTFDYSNVNDIKDLPDMLDNVLSYVAMHHKPQNNTFLEIEYAVVDALLKTLDSNSGIITPKIYKEFMIETEGSFGGLGIVIGIREGQLTVISPIEGTPAYLAGVKSKDKIVQIEDGSTVNMSLLEAVSKLRGPKGTKVNIHVMRDGFAIPKKFTIKRDTIKIESVDAFLLSDNILYLKVRDFQKNTLSSIKEKANKLTSDNINSVNGIILDLRGNPGGLLDQSKKISDLFLQNGNIVSTQIGTDKNTYSANDEYYEYRGKLIVLVDSGSASASEIVAGALKNNNRALIVGDQTFGKGSVQQVFSLKDNAALKLTIANYLTPGDISIQDIGITPDIFLQPVRVSKDAIDLFTNENQDSNKDNNINYSQNPKKSIKFIEALPDPDQEEDMVEEALSKQEKLSKIQEDFAVIFSRNIINNSSSPQTITQAGFIESELEKYTKQQQDQITLELNELDIDWTNTDKTNNENLFTVTVSKSKNNVNAGDIIDIGVTVKNTGSKSTERLYAVTKSDNPVFNDKEYIFGKIPAGNSKTWTNSFEVPKWSISRNDKVELIFKSNNDEQILSKNFDVQTIQQQRPAYAFNYELIDDGRFETKGNSNSIAEEGELVGLRLKLKNTGSGESEKTTVLLKNNLGEDLYLKKGRAKIENLKPNEVREELFLFSVNNPINNLDVEIQIFDDNYREGVTEKIKLDSTETSNDKIKELTAWYKVNADSVPIYGSPSEKSSIVAYASKDSLFKSDISNNEWAKVSLDSSSRGWINMKFLTTTDKKVTEANITITSSFQQPPQIKLDQPPLLIKNNEISLKGIVQDSDGVRLITVYLGEDKVYLKNFYSQSAAVDTKISLKSGINYINIFAKDKLGLISKKTYIVRYDA